MRTNDESAATSVDGWLRQSTPRGPIRLHDETLRDGLQSPSVVQPPIERRIEILQMMARLRIDSVDLGMPSSTAATYRDVLALARAVAASGMRMSPSCAARTLEADVCAVAEVGQRAGIELWAMTFVGTNPIRWEVEGWDRAWVVRQVSSVVKVARREGLRVCIVTEDTTRSPEDVVAEVYLAALDAGAERICVCDTVGHAMPWGAAAVVSWIRRVLAGKGYRDIGIDWHGHNDRGMALANSLAAVCAGADCVHGTALGIGERSGNASIEQLLINLDELGWRDGALSLIPQYCALVHESCRITIPPNQPFVGSDAFRTVAGVHAAAIRKARASSDPALAERVYSAIPASLLGVTPRIDVGPSSGLANILHWLEMHGHEPHPAVVKSLKRGIAEAVRTLSDEELTTLVERALDEGTPRPKPVG